MSDLEAEHPEGEALDGLEEVLDKVLRRVSTLKARMQDAEERRDELQELLERFRSGGEDPAELARRADRLEEENQELRRRLKEGRSAVERMLARVRFLKENP